MRLTLEMLCSGLASFAGSGGKVEVAAQELMCPSS
jgi:hypothetical protein